MDVNEIEPFIHSQRPESDVGHQQGMNQTIQEHLLIDKASGTRRTLLERAADLVFDPCRRCALQRLHVDACTTVAERADQKNVGHDCASGRETVIGAAVEAAPPGLSG